MLRRQALVHGTVLCAVLAVLIVPHGRASAQTTGGAGGGFGGGTSTSGSSSSAPGGGFTGGGTSAGGGFTGGGSSSSTSGGFTGGGTGSSGTSFIGGTGGTGIAGGGTGGTTIQVPTSANPFIGTYVNPISAGMLNTSGAATSTKAFGQPVFNVYSTATSGTTGTTGISGGVGGTSTNFGFNTFGMARTPTYAAVPGETMPLIVHANPELRATVVDVLGRATVLQSVAPLKVRVDNATVFVDGTVATAKQKRLIEGMIRLTPGVRDVVNNVEISETLPQPRPKASPVGP